MHNYKAIGINQAIKYTHPFIVDFGNEVQVFR